MLRNKLVINEASQKSDSSDSNKSDTDTKESRYFQTTDAEDADISLKFLEIEVELKNFLKNIGYGKPVAYVYNPLEYAFQIHSEFVHKYCRGRKRILFVGMNPGPFGACQTGVPFGEVNYVKNWFRLENSVQKPKIECPERPVLGLACTRSEISGKRFWGLFERLCQTPENFFKHAFIHNYCPLAFMGRSGINLTPNKLQVQERKSLELACDDNLFKLISLLKVDLLIAIGRYTETKAKNILKTQNPCNTQVLFLHHPSPRVVGNENWEEKAEKFLHDNDLVKYFQVAA